MSKFIHKIDPPFRVVHPVTGEIVPMDDPTLPVSTSMDGINLHDFIVDRIKKSLEDEG